MSNFAGCESFLNSNSLDILALYEANVVEQFLWEVLSLIQKESAIDMPRLAVFVKEGIPSFLDRFYFIQCLTSFSIIDHCPLLNA